MFEDMTYENILESLLKSVPSDVDKREGSIIFDALSPVALELARMYIDIDIVLNNAFADTAEREYLTLRAKERGIEPKKASRAVFKMEVTYSGSDENVKVGDRFNKGNLNYIVTEQMANETSKVIDSFPFDSGASSESTGQGESIPGWWKVECETEGSIGNSQFGDLIPLQNVNDLISAKITALLIPGEDIEDTETFRERYFEEINNDAFGGNRADYKKWVKNVDGVGQVKVIRTPESGGTVGIIITDSENNIPADELLNTVKEYLDPAENEGLGCGIAPVGHVVDVAGAESRQLSIVVNWQLLSGANADTVCAKSADIIKDYLAELNKKWENSTSLTVNAFQLMAKLSELNEIVDITELAIDGERSAVLNNNEIFDYDFLVVKEA